MFLIVLTLFVHTRRGMTDRRSEQSVQTWMRRDTRFMWVYTVYTYMVWYGMARVDGSKRALIERVEAKRRRGRTGRSDGACYVCALHRAAFRAARRSVGASRGVSRGAVSRLLNRRARRARNARRLDEKRERRRWRCARNIALKRGRL